MISSYWDLYVAYINYCVRYNSEHGFDPHHYEMEWNHYLPQCVFGDQPLGQWLLVRQHAIASALQTLAFQRSCLCGWHKKHLPKQLADLAWEIYVEDKRQRMAPIAKRLNSLANNPAVNAIRSEVCRARNLTKSQEEILKIAAKVAEKNRGKKHPSLAGENNPAKREEVKAKIREARMRQANVNSEGLKRRYMCTVTGFISNAAGLKKYQLRRGIDTSNRVEL